MKALLLMFTMPLIVIASGCGGSFAPTLMPSNDLLYVTVGCSGGGQPDRIQCYATAHYTDAGRNVSNSAAWQSSNPEVATVSTTGLVNIVNLGKTTITATYDEHSASLTLQFPAPLSE